MSINNIGQYSKQLPKAYQLGPNNGQNCSNCEYFKNNGWCVLFNHSVLPMAWCKKWEKADG